MGRREQVGEGARRAGGWARGRGPARKRARACGGARQEAPDLGKGWVEIAGERLRGTAGPRGVRGDAVARGLVHAGGLAACGQRGMRARARDAPPGVHERLGAGRLACQTIAHRRPLPEVFLRQAIVEQLELLDLLLRDRARFGDLLGEDGEILLEGERGQGDNGACQISNR